MRHDQTDPGQNTRSRSDGWNPELQHAKTGDTVETIETVETGEIVESGNGRGELRDRRDRAGAYDAGVAASSWQDIKSRFVDDPAGAIAAAEELLRLAVDNKIRALNDEAGAICARGRDEDDSSTETLRTRLIRYQSYCERLAGSSADPTEPH